MHLLVCVVNDTAKVNEIVGGLVKIGVTGATVIDSHGTEELAGGDEAPALAGFRHLLRGGRNSNRTIFSVIDSDDTLERAIQVVEEACGRFERPCTGILFVVPVSRVQGLVSEPR